MSELVTKEKIEEILVRLEEKCPMRFYPAVNDSERVRLKRELVGLPEDYLKLLSITNGCVINEPGMELYNASKMMTLVGHQSGNYSIGKSCTGDGLMMNENGQVYRIAHEDGSVFLEWNNILEYLKDELWMAS